MSQKIGSDIERLWIMKGNSYLYRLKSIEDEVLQIQSRSMSDPTFSDIDFKKEITWVWITLKIWFWKDL